MEHVGRWGIQSLTQRSRDSWEDVLQAENNPGSIHEWNDRITGVLENLLRWSIMLFMVRRHAARGEEVKLFQLWKFGQNMTLVYISCLAENLGLGFSLSANTNGFGC